MTLRSEPRPYCPYCRGVGIVSVSKDPDEVADCVCTDLAADEREAQRIAELDARQAAYRHEREQWWFDHETAPEIASNAFFRGWDAAVAAGFRLSEVPEPSARALTPCGNLVCTGCRVCGCPALGIEPQGEPSDAQVLAALDAQCHQRITRSSIYVSEELGKHPGEWSESDKSAMRAALRAAGEAQSATDAETIQRLRDQIEEARNAWWSATEPGDSGLVYTDKIEDAMDDIWSAIGRADWAPDAAGGAR